MAGEALIRDYLGRLDTASWPLPAGRREELRAEVADQIEAALAETGSRDEVTIRNVLERLGRPEEIAAADIDPVAVSSTPSPSVARGSWGPVEVIAILLLSVGAVLLPVVGPLVGLLFVWGSPQWTSREKTIASAIVLAMLALPVLFLIAV